tara:strand:+ start:727 stop:945 length:219 start_codon:yes stop_codon:yes gene_type:complete
MFFAKKIIAANILIGGAVLAAAGTAAVAYAMSDPNSRDKLKDCSDRMRDCVNRMCNRSSNGGDPEMANSTPN